MSTVTAPTLTPHDRCDGCGVDDMGRGIAQARVRVRLLSGTLDLCGHHFEVNEDALSAQALEIIDEREHIDG